ncbi:MAG TPA: hypothetical protein VFZ22_19510 [Pyrinomonadaceae bacterium]|nr:hypothetical protein [Pyrinomonadaceae bacterium]
MSITYYLRLKYFSSTRATASRSIRDANASHRARSRRPSRDQTVRRNATIKNVASIKLNVMF